MVEGCDDQADRAAIDMPKGMSTHLLIGRTHIRTGRTTNTTEGVFETRIGAHLAASIIEQDNVHLFARGRWTSEKGGVAGNGLGGRATGQQTQLGHGLRVSAN